MARKKSGTSGSGTDLAVVGATPLAGETAVDDALIAKSVVYINGVHTAKGLETARAIGQHIADTYFGGDTGAFRERGKKHVSFRKLAEHEDLAVSPTTLYHSVAVLDQLNLLPEDIASAMPFSHHKLLIPVKNEEIKVKLAEEAVEKGLSKIKFGERIQEVLKTEPKTTKAGRPRLPEFVKALSDLNGIYDRASSDSPDDDAVQQYTADKAKTVLDRAEAEIQRLADLVIRLREQFASAAKD